MASSMAQMTQILSQGQASAQAAITQLQTAATKASTAAQNAQTKDKNWSKTVQNEINTRGNNALAVKPNNVPTDLKGTATSVSTYLDTVRGALGDSKITKQELSSISLAGANAVAGLNAHGGTQFQGLSNSINSMTKQIARGETPKAKSSFSGLEQSAKALSSVPSLPGGGGVNPPGGGGVNPPGGGGVNPPRR